MDRNTRQRLGEERYLAVQAFIRALDPKLRPYAISYGEYVVKERAQPPVIPNWMLPTQAAGIRRGILRVTR